MSLNAHFDDMYREMIDRATDPHLTPEEKLANMSMLETFSKCRPPTPEPEPAPEPTTFAGKFKRGAKAAWDNETTRVLIKAGGSIGGVGLVVWSTIHRDHVIDREALNQANRPQQ